MCQHALRLRGNGGHLCGAAPTSLPAFLPSAGQGHGEMAISVTLPSHPLVISHTPARAAQAGLHRG